MKPFGPVVDLVAYLISVLICCTGLTLNIFEGVSSKSDKRAVALFVIMLCISFFCLVRSIKRLKGNRN